MNVTQDMYALREASAASADAAHAATRMRELAHQRIVDAFRRQVHDDGPGPTEDDLQSFARLALVERALCARQIDQPAG